MDSNRPSQIEDLGKYLEEERLQRQLTLQAVSEKTRISVKVLRYIEQGSLEEIKTPFLIRGFIRTYCSALGVDPEPLLERYGPEIQAYGLLPQKAQVLRGISQPGIKKRWIFLTLALVGIMVLGTWAVEIWISKRNALLNSVPPPMVTDTDSHDELLSELSKREGMSQATGQATGARSDTGTAANQPVVSTPEVSPERPKQRQTEATTPESTAKSASQAPTGTEESLAAAPPAGAVVVQAPPPSGNHRLVAEADKETWMQVVIDGKVTKTGLLKPGEKREWEAADDMRVVVGNARGVRLTWDSEPIDYPGKPGQVVKLRLPETKSESRSGTRQ